MGLHKNIFKDKTYTIIPKTITMSRFGPSGSFTSSNIVLERRTAVTNKVKKNMFFDFISMMILFYVDIPPSNKAVAYQMIAY